jgi:hypothetical protein
MLTDKPDNLTDDGLDALVAHLNAGYARLALAAEASYADHLSLDGNRLTIRRRPTSSLQFTPLPAPPVDQSSN